MGLKLNMPGLSGNVEKDLKNLNSYVFQLTEDLRYLLNNLDVTNFNDLGLMRYENGRLQIYTDKLQAAVNSLEIKIDSEKDRLSAQIKAEADALKLSFENAEKNLSAQYTTSAEELRGTITEKLNGVDTKISQWQQTVDGFSATVNEKLGGVDTKVSQWQQTVDGFSATVSEKLDGVDAKMSTWQHDIDGFRSEVSTVETNLDDFMTYANSVMMQNARQISLVVQETDGEYVLNTASIVAGIEEDESFIDLVADTITLVGLTRFYSEYDGPNLFQKVEIEDGEIRFDSGWLCDAGDGTLLLASNGGPLHLEGGNAHLVIGGTYQFYFEDGTYYELTKEGLEYHG